jgi:hypothetical protein
MKLVKLALIGVALSLSGAAYADSISEAEKDFVSQTKPDYEALHRLERHNLGIGAGDFRDVVTTAPAAPAKIVRHRHR